MHHSPQHPADNAVPCPGDADVNSIVRHVFALAATQDILQHFSCWAQREKGDAIAVPHILQDGFEQKQGAVLHQCSLSNIQPHEGCTQSK